MAVLITNATCSTMRGTPPTTTILRDVRVYIKPRKITFQPEGMITTTEILFDADLDMQEGDSITAIALDAAPSFVPHSPYVITLVDRRGPDLPITMATVVGGIR